MPGLKAAYKNSELPPNTTLLPFKLNIQKFIILKDEYEGLKLALENELIIGLTGSLGVDFSKVGGQLARNLAKAGYHTEIIRIADFFPKRRQPSRFAQEYWKMQYGTKERQSHGSDYWAKRVISHIFKLRAQLAKKHKKIAYIVRSIKNKAELNLLAKVYAQNFISVSIFSDEIAIYKHLKNKLKITPASRKALLQMKTINLALGLSSEEPSEDLVEFLLHKDQEETNPLLKESGQNLYECYSSANFFIYEDRNLKTQVNRFIEMLFNYPFVEPTVTEYFMFCAQAAAYRSLDVDRQVGAVIVNQEQELVAVGFNDVTQLGDIDLRDFKQQYDYGHLALDKIADTITSKLKLNHKARTVLRKEINGITEFKRSTHAEMAAILDASRRGVSIRNCTMYVNYYPCHNCTKHIIASGIRKVVFLHPYAKSKAREMYPEMIRLGLFDADFKSKGQIILEPFLGVSPNRFIASFANDKITRLERVDGKENGKIIKWKINKNSVPRDLADRQPYTYLLSEWAVLHDCIPDISWLYKTK